MLPQGGCLDTFIREESRASGSGNKTIAASSGTPRELQIQMVASPRKSLSLRLTLSMICVEPFCGAGFEPLTSLTVRRGILPLVLAVVILRGDAATRSSVLRTVNRRGDRTELFDKAMGHYGLKDALIRVSVLAWSPAA